MLRAGPFSDERVIRLINRRFVPLYFDLSLGGAAADRKARQAVVKAKPDLGKAAVETPPLLVMTPDGKVLGEVDNYVGEEELWKSLLALLAKHAEWNAPSDEEKRIAREGTPIERATLLFDLGNLAAARRLLADQSGANESLLRVHLCRLERDWSALELELGRVVAPELADGASVERGWLQIARGDFAAARKSVVAVASSSPYSSEARYLDGIASWRAKKPDEARATWKALIDDAKVQDRWIYRADWAYTQSLEPARGEFSTSDKRHSPLGRIGYMGRRNPDLETDAPPPR